MIIFGPLLVLLGICALCWLLFTLAVFALPFLVGLEAAIWAFHTGAGVIGAGTVGVVAGGVCFGLGQLAFTFVPWMWLRLLIIVIYVAPAFVAGYAATHGLALATMPSPVWQDFFSVIGAIAVGVTSFMRFTGMAPPRAAGQSMVRG